MKKKNQQIFRNWKPTNFSNKSPLMWACLNVSWDRSILVIVFDANMVCANWIETLSFLHSKERERER